MTDVKNATKSMTGVLNDVRAEIQSDFEAWLWGRDYEPTYDDIAEWVQNWLRCERGGEAMVDLLLVSDATLPYRGKDVDWLLAIACALHDAMPEAPELYTIWERNKAFAGSGL